MQDTDVSHYPDTQGNLVKGDSSNMFGAKTTSDFKPSIARFTQGAAEGTYREIIHATPRRVAQIKAVLGWLNANGKEINLEVI